MGDFTYKVNVKATVSDEASGNVFAMLMSADLDASAIQAQVKGSTDNMVLLGSFSGPGGAPLEGNLTTYFESVSAVQSNSFTTLTANVDIEYYVYIYAIDQYGNDILIKRPEAITLDIASTNVNVNATLFIGASTGLFHETRDATNITQAIVTSVATYGSNYFGYINRNSFTPNYANVLYAYLTANPGEFVVDAVYSFAVETPPATIADNETKFLNLIESTNPARDYTTFTDPVNLLFNSPPQSFSYEIDTFYANVDSNVKYTMVFGTNYTLFHACRVRDMDLYVINQAGNVSTGEAPTIVSSTAAVSSTEQEFIANVDVAYTSGTGSFTVTTTLDRGSDIGDKDLYLYTAAFGYAEYDHAALLANLDTVFVDVRNVTTQTNPSLNLSQVRDANGSLRNVTDTNAIFVYQFASVGRDADEIALGAPTSNVTDFDGGSRILSEIPKIAYDAVTSNVTVYHYAEDFDHWTFKVDQATSQTSAELDAFARDLFVRYSAALIDPSPKSYVVTWTSTVTIDDETHWKPGQTEPNYYASESLMYYYLEITQGSVITFSIGGGHALYESDYDATTDTFTRQFTTSSPTSITFNDPGLRGFNCLSGHSAMNLVVKTIPSVVHRGRTRKGVVSDPIHTNHLGSAFNNLLDAESIVTIGSGITTVNYLVTTSELTGNVDIQSFS